MVTFTQLTPAGREVVSHDLPATDEELAAIDQMSDMESPDPDEDPDSDGYGWERKALRGMW